MTIFFLIDSEAGHILPTFKIADNFIKAGYKVIYISIEERHSLIVENGYENLVIFPNENIITPLINDNKRNCNYSLSIIDGALDYLIEENKPNLLVSTIFLPWKAFLMSLKYNIPLFMVSSAPELKVLRRGNLNQFKDFLEGEFGHFSGSAPLKIFNFIQGKCPDFDQTRIDECIKYYFLYTFPLDVLIDDIKVNEKTFFIGSRIRNTKELNSRVTKILEAVKEKKIIYASLGSQAHLYKESMMFYKLLIAVMEHEAMSNFHLIISINEKLEKQLNIKNSLQNISMLSWVPQLQILERASVFITHGGRGSISEAIITNSPMLVIPMGRDQFENATIIQEKELGYEADINNISTEELVGKIVRLENNNTIKANLKIMNNRFLEKENSKIELQLLEELLFESFTF